ncbi:MAG: UDP-N-acetylglucosamine 2-epimerase (non-hydrolyzing) [Methanosphaera sp. rholeuAM270]|nr:MAG: UDP-N-acetylglucosamine 2-epimerase (non-hydrolyzing) [Methanosphaera sp. rholeuAM270]
MKVGIILGTRPEIIKMSQIIDELNNGEDEYVIIHTGQHYDIEMSKQFFTDLKLPLPKYNIGIGSSTAIQQISKIISELESILNEEKVDIVLVQGDTNAVLAGALAANKLKIPVGHVEAGLRSFDKDMPEETNRIIADNCSNLFFVPTKETAINLQNEGIHHRFIYVTGNTIVDACKRNLKIALEESNLSSLIDFEEYITLTLHRAENVDNPERLENIVNSLLNIRSNIVFPLHPHTRKSLENNGLYERIANAEHIQITKPLGYLDFLYLLSKSKLIITDSGGVQEEAITLNIPCVTLRYNTERPETISAGGNILAGTDDREIRNNIERILNNEEIYTSMSQAVNPYGDGKSSKRILKIIRDNLRNKSIEIRHAEEILDFKGYYMLEVTDDISVGEFEKRNKHHIIEQIFHENVPELIEDSTNLKNKVVIVKEFNQNKEMI